MPSFGMGKFVGRALESVACQTWQDWEVILVDDRGPEDGTREAVEEFARQHPEKRIRYTRNSVNVGCGQSRNIAIAEARGDILALLDPDDYWGVSHLEESVRALADADLSFCRCRGADQDGNDKGPHLGGRIAELEASFPGSLFRENFLLPSTTVFKKSIIDRIGGFISRQEASNAADWDFYLRCVAHDLRFAFLEAENCHYRHHSGSATANYPVMLRACVSILRKNRRMARGRMRAELTGSLHDHLCKLTYLRISFREWDGLGYAAEALALKPFDIDPLARVFRGLRNNWHRLN